MKYKVFAEVEGDIIVKPPKNLVASKDEFEYELEVSPEGKVRFVSVSIRVPPDRVSDSERPLAMGKESPSFTSQSEVTQRSTRA